MNTISTNPCYFSKCGVLCCPMDVVSTGQGFLPDTLIFNLKSQDLITSH